MNQSLSINSIIEASKRIKDYAHRTPILTSGSINKIAGCSIHFKCENLQKVGAFKFRGAFNAVASLKKEELERGVATHSSGNHAAALALAAQMHGVKAYIIMPHTAPAIKKKAVEGYGAEIVFSEPTLESRQDTLNKVVEETGAHFVPPFNDTRVIAGQATAALELIEETEKLNFIIAPVGGGGLLSGTSLSAKFFGNDIKVIGAEPKGADDAFRSIRDNKIYPSVNPQTICDGLLTSLGDITFEVIKENVNEIITVSEETIIEAMRMIWERMKIIVEPSSAVVLAAILENKEKFKNRNIGVILSGGNVDLEKLPWNK
ncbi:MAG: pyridoxal-phosphate dependent enzyme [Bacteroidetes bacterium]|nr:pyridoxal-phosphate dependent enzyme [Bacteroidota bacterium]